VVAVSTKELLRANFPSAVLELAVLVEAEKAGG